MGRQNRAAGKVGLSSYRLIITTMLVALSVVLHLFKFPFPLMPALKFDLVGVPLWVVAYCSLKHFAISLPVVWASIMYMSGDLIGASMKILAEASTILPSVLVFRKLKERSRSKLAATASVVLGTLSRTAVMALANYLVVPRWALMVGWASTYEEAYRIMLYAMPYICLFNIILGAIVCVAGYYAVNLLRRTQVLRS